jgi:hypothetical protein
VWPLRTGGFVALLLLLLGLAVVGFHRYVARREIVRAQEIMRDASQLEVGKSTLTDVLDFSRKYEGDATGSWHADPCRETDCLVTIDPMKNDFLERHPEVATSVRRFTRSQWDFVMMAWVKDGKLAAVERWFTYATRDKSVALAVIGTLSRPGGSLCRDPYYQLHPMFAAYPGPKHFNVWVSAAAGPEQNMLLFNLECAEGTAGCKSYADVVPVAWSRFESDEKQVGANPQYSSEDFSSCH